MVADDDVVAQESQSPGQHLVEVGSEDEIGQAGFAEKMGEPEIGGGDGDLVDPGMEEVPRSISFMLISVRRKAYLRAAAGSKLARRGAKRLRRSRGV